MTRQQVQESGSTRYVCPVCGREMLSPNMLCSGGFLDENHPANVVPVAGHPPVREERDA